MIGIHAIIESGYEWKDELIYEYLFSTSDSLHVDHLAIQILVCFCPN